MPQIEIGSSPNEEDCVQVSSTKDYIGDMQAELAAYKSQLARAYPPPEGCYFKVCYHSHDFGRYGEVAAVYESDSNQEQVNWAYDAEAGCNNWDEEAAKELAAYKVRKARLAESADKG